MTIEIVKWKEMMDEWHQEPQKLLAWLTKLFWDAEIDPSSSACWKAYNGVIMIGKERTGHVVPLSARAHKSSDNRA